MNSKIEAFFSKDSKWQSLYQKLREICLECTLEEDYKWMHPCYTYKNNNVLIIHGFKAYCAILFTKGVLLKDDNNILIQQTENVQSARQIRFTNIQEIIDLEPVIKSYIFEAIEVERLGLKVKVKSTQEFDVPIELVDAFKSNASLKVAFEGLTPGRQRGYLLYFSQAKQSKTKVSRIEKYTPHILNGKGLKDSE